MKITGFHRLVLASCNPEKTRTFYEALGGKVIWETEQAFCVKLDGGALIEIVPVNAHADPGSDGWDHMALLVESCEAACAVIEQAGGRIEKRPTPNKMGDTPIINAVTYGVDGEKIEVIQMRTEKKADAEADLTSRKEKRMQIFALSHVQLNSSDVQKSRAFYEEAFGAGVTTKIMEKNDPEKLKGFMIQLAPQTVLELQPPRFGKTGKTSSWNTLAVVTDDIETLCQKIEAAGGTLCQKTGAAGGTCMTGIEKERFGGSKVLRAVVSGTEGERIELIQIIPDGNEEE